MDSRRIASETARSLGGSLAYGLLLLAAVYLYSSPPTAGLRSWLTTKTPVYVEAAVIVIAIGAPAYALHRIINHVEVSDLGD